MTQPIFRPCLKADLPALARLVEQLYISDPGDAPANPDITLTFAEFERHPQKGRIVLFDLGGEVAGYAILVFFWSNEFGGDFVEIDELLVDEKHRGSGIGRAFFAWLALNYQDCAGYALQVSARNEEARKLYLSVGFEPARSQYMVKLGSLGAAQDKAAKSSSA